MAQWISFAVCFAVLAGIGACGSSVDSEGTGGQSSTSSSSGSNTTSSSNIACGATTCAADEFCNDTSGKCGAGDAAALKCTQKPMVCSDGYPPVCGCDGKVYPLDCAAAMAGVSLDGSGRCTLSAGHFACGYDVCLTGQFCNIAQGTAPGLPSYTCENLPTACGSPVTCNCLPPCPTGTTAGPCTVDANGIATQTCISP